MIRFATTTVACMRIQRRRANARWASTNEGGPTAGETISSGSTLRDDRRQIVCASAVSGVAPGDVGRAGHPLDGEQMIGAVRLCTGDVYDEIRSRRPRWVNGRRGAWYAGRAGGDTGLPARERASGDGRLLERAAVDEGTKSSRPN